MTCAQISVIRLVFADARCLRVLGPQGDRGARLAGGSAAPSVKLSLILGQVRKDGLETSAYPSACVRYGTRRNTERSAAFLKLR
jgi:hypothetical protein